MMDYSPFDTDVYGHQTISSCGSLESAQKSYDTDTFVTETLSHESLDYSNTFESSDSHQTYQNSQSTVIESPRKTPARLSYSESFEGSSLSGTGSRLIDDESREDGYSYTDTFEESDESFRERSWSTSVTEDSEVVAEAKKAETKFLEERYEKLVYGSDFVSLTPPPRQISKGERYLEKFCQEKLKSIHRNQNRDDSHIKRRSPKPSTPSYDQTPVEHYGISEGQVSRLKLENLLTSMRRAATAEIHSPNKCRDCRMQIAKYKQDEYLKHKTAIARRKMVDERFETLCAKDSLAVFGEMIGSLPRLTEDRDEIWEKLLAPLQMNKKETRVESPI